MNAPPKVKRQPIVKVWCLPNNLGEKKLKELFSSICAAFRRMPVFGVASEDDLLVLFPKDQMAYGLGSEILVEVESNTDFSTVTDPIEPNSRLAGYLVAAVKAMFPKAHVMCRVQPANLKQTVYQVCE